MVYLLLFILLNILYWLVPELSPLWIAIIFTTFIFGFFRFIVLAKREGSHMMKEVNEAAVQHRDTASVFYASYVSEYTQRTQFIETPSMITFRDLQNGSETVKMTNNQLLLNKAKRYSQMIVYYNGTYIVDILPLEPQT